MTTPFFPDILSPSTLKSRGSRLQHAVELILNHQNESRTDMIARQESALRDLVSYAYQTIPLYRSKYDAAGFHPSDLHNSNDIKLIPILTKDDLRNSSRDSLHADGAGTSDHFVQTSGSTGSPIGIYKSQESLDWFSARNMVLFHQWCNGQPLTGVLFILDSKPHNIDYAIADQLRTTVMDNRFVSTFEHVSVLADAIDLFQPDYISTYPGTIRNIAAFLQKRSIEHHQVRLIHLTSEVLDAATRGLLKRVFPCADLIETYTSTEAGLMGFECPSHGGFHLAEDSIIVELNDTQTIRTDGFQPAIVTDLINRATPIIRYNGLGDILIPSDQPCPCGSPLRHIRSVEGRIVDSIHLTDGSLISPYVLTNILADQSGITAYQILQHTIDRFEIRVVLADSSREECTALTARVTRQFCDVLGSAVQCEIRFVQEIVPEPGRHKIPLVVSMIENTR